MPDLIALDTKFDRHLMQKKVLEMEKFDWHSKLQAFQTKKI